MIPTLCIYTKNKYQIKSIIYRRNVNFDSRKNKKKRAKNTIYCGQKISQKNLKKSVDNVFSQ